MTAILPALGPHATTDQIDDAIHSLIDLHMAGEMTEENARREISGALYVSGIHEQVAAKRTDLSPQGRTDLADSLLRLVTEKVIGTGKGDYSLEMGRERSACGWARQLASAAVQSEMRNGRRSATRNGTPLDPHGREFSVLAGQQTLIVFDDHTSHVDGDLVDLMETYAQSTKGMRETDRVLASAEAICVGFGIAPALRPEIMADRDYALTAMTDDPTLAHRALRAWHSLVHGSDRAAVGDIDDRILSLWDEQTEDSSTTLLAMSDDIAHMLALAAVSPRPRPKKKTLAKFKTVVMVGDGTRDKAWRELASALVDCYVASEFEAVSQYATVSDEARDAALVGHTIDRARFTDILDRVAQHPTAPLGRSHVQILGRLAQFAEAILGEETGTSLRSAA